jgi:MinD-like ATPase involved in chromosome partitioning or flagellar assembly
VTMLAVTSAKASPGVTTLAVALAATWPFSVGAGPGLVVEADGDGGSLAARLGLGWEPGLVGLATAGRRSVDADAVMAHAQPVGERLGVLCGPPAAQQAQAALASVAGRLADRLAALEGLVVVDVGRLGLQSPALPLARAAELCLLVARPRLDEAQHLASRGRMLVEAGCTVGLVCVGDRPYDPAEVAASAGLELVGVVADDARTARALAEGRAVDRLLRRSELWRTATKLSTVLAERLTASTSREPGSAPADDRAPGDEASPAPEASLGGVAAGEPR